MIFYTPFDLPESKPSSSGSRFDVKYIEKLDKNGASYLEEVGRSDLTEIINANFEACKISNIVKRFTAGDVNAVQRGNPVFIDATVLPKDFIEYHNLIAKAESYFDTLDPVSKAKYNNNALQYLSAVAKEKFELKEVVNNVVEQSEVIKDSIEGTKEL